MKTKEILSSLMILSIVAFVVMSCFPKDDLVYSGPTVTQFKNYSLGQVTGALLNKGISATDTQNDSTHTVYTVAFAPVPPATTPAPHAARGVDTVMVELVGPQRGTDLVLDFSVRSTSTAIEGTHYNLHPVGVRTVTIPAHSSIGYILMDIIPGSVTSGSVKVSIDLLGNTAVQPAKNFKSFFVVIKP